VQGDILEGEAARAPMRKGRSRSIESRTLIIKYGVWSGQTPADQILYFGGNEHDADRNRKSQYDAARLFDCSSHAVTYVKSPKFDTFCAGHAFLRSINQVKFLAAGGTEKFMLTAPHHHVDHFPGLRDAAVFSSPSLVLPPGSFHWSGAPRMDTGPVVSDAHHAALRRRDSSVWPSWIEP
jgi:hypothetical protein